MRKAPLLIMMALLLAGMATADISVVEAPQEEQMRLPAIMVNTMDNTLVIGASVDAQDVHVFLDGILLKRYPSLQEGEMETITTPLRGEHAVEIRFLRTYRYTWERYTITMNDEPARLKYAKYDKDKKQMEFSITGATFIHPHSLNTTSDNSNEPFTDFNATINSRTKLYCYPRITTGKDLFFACRSNEYVNRLDLSLRVGVKETTMLNITSTKNQEAPQESETIPIETQTPQEEDLVDVARADNITMTDTIKQSSTPIPVTVFIILLFLAVMTIMFIASHHKHENKQAGVHHPTKKR